MFMPRMGADVCPCGPGHVTPKRVRMLMKVKASPLLPVPSVSSLVMSPALGVSRAGRKWAG